MKRSIQKASDLQWSGLPEVKPSLSREIVVSNPDKTQSRSEPLDRVGVFIVATQYQLFKQTD